MSIKVDRMCSKRQVYLLFLGLPTPTSQPGTCKDALLLPVVLGQKGS